MQVQDMFAYGVGAIILLLLLYWVWPCVMVALVFYGLYHLFHHLSRTNREDHTTD